MKFFDEEKLKDISLTNNNIQIPSALIDQLQMNNHCIVGELNIQQSNESIIHQNISMQS